MVKVVVKVDAKEIQNICGVMLYRGRLDHYKDGEFVRSEKAGVWRNHYEDALEDAQRLAELSGEDLY